MSLDDRDWYREEMKRRARQKPPKHGYIHPALLRHHKPHVFTLKPRAIAASIATGATIGILIGLFQHRTDLLAIIDYLLLRYTL
jgi:hypothetical protein